MNTRPSGTRIFIWEFIPITNLSYATTKKPKKVCCGAKVIESPEVSEGPHLLGSLKVLSDVGSFLGSSVHFFWYAATFQQKNVQQLSY